GGFRSEATGPGVLPRLPTETGVETGVRVDFFTSAPRTGPSVLTSAARQRSPEQPTTAPLRTETGVRVDFQNWGQSRPTHRPREVSGTFPDLKPLQAHLGENGGRFTLHWMRRLGAPATRATVVFSRWVSRDALQAS